MPRVITSLCTIARVALAACAVAMPAAAQHNTQRTVVPADGQGSGVSRPYGTEIVFSGLSGTIASADVILHNVHHDNPDDMDVLLVSPSGKRIILMSDAGGTADMRGHTVRFSASAASLVPDASTIGDNSTYRPSNYGGGDADLFPAPAPAGPYADTLSSLAGGSPNGTWRLFVHDDADDNAGEIQAWSIALTLHRQASQNAPVSIVTGSANPYPSTLAVQNWDGRIKKVRVTANVTHPSPDDIDMLLVGPGGRKVMLMSDAGGTSIANGLVNRAITFDDAAATTLPDSGVIGTGTYRPTNYATGDAMASPAPAGPYDPTLAAFAGLSPNAEWKLFVVDDTVSNNGTVNWWMLEVEVTPSLDDTSYTVQAPTTNTTTTTFVPLRIVTSHGGLVSWRHYGTGDSGVAEVSPGGFFSTYTSLVPMPESVNSVQFAFTNYNGERATELRAIYANEFTNMFAEGATSPFFDLDYVIANPTGNTAPISVQFLTPSGPVGPKAYSLPARTRLRINAKALASEFPVLANTAVSAVVTSTDSRPLVAERAMSWDASGYSGHAGSAVEGPSPTWYFAEGYYSSAAQGGFDTFVLLANPDDGKSADVTVTFLREGDSPITATYTLPPNTRQNVWAAEFPDLLNRSFGIGITANEPIVAERAMYFTGGTGQFFGGGHESAGVTSLKKRWIFAEGATGPYFDSFILVSNPNPFASTVTYTFYTDAGETFTTTRNVPPKSRFTLNIEDVDPGLANVAVSTTVVASTPIVAERAIYWPGPVTTWHEAHNSFGVNDPGERWAVADARQGGPRGYDSYVLIVNPEPVDAVVKLTFFRNGVAPVVKTITVPATSRYNVTLGGNAPELILPGNEATEYSLFVETQNRTQIVVEKAMYWNANGVAWAGGSNVAGTRLP